MSLINGYIIICLVVTLAYLVGLLTHLIDLENNKCEMTFMFEYPQFVRISNKVDQRYPKYGLYAYSEGRMTEKTRDMFFDGIPVLFIPGNAGSYKQVRSLASIALRKALNSRTPYHFDYFTVDLNDELSGLNGALLYDQLTYVNHSVSRILELYAPRRNPPESVVLFGHSMGGVIATRLVSSLPPDSNLISIVLTLASPHRRLPMTLDVYAHRFYEGLEDAFPSNVTFVSLGGGYNDLLVPSFLTKLTNNNSLNVETTHVPRAWVSTDHLCILWCKQLILALNRALFDSVDPKTRQISTDFAHRHAMFHHHLVQHPGISSHMINNYASKVHMKNDGEWFETIHKQYTHRLTNGVKQTHWYMVRLVMQPQYEALTIVAVNLETVDWVFACGAHIPRGNNRVCEEFKHLTQRSEIAPSAKYKRRSLHINMHDIARSDTELTHIVFRVLPTNEPVVFHVDIHNVGERRKSVELPNPLSLRKLIVINETAEKTLSYELQLPQLQHIIQSYQLYVEALQCTGDYRHATASLVIPWDNQDHHKHFTETDTKPMHIRLYDSRPKSASNQSAFVRLTLDPKCRYRISVRSSILGMLAQMARFYTPMLVANVAVVILMALSSQLKSIDESGTCSLFFTAFQAGTKPYYILTGVKLFSRLLSVQPLTNVFPVPDWTMVTAEGMDFFLLPLLLFLCGVGIAWMLGILLAVSLAIFETTVHKVALKFLARTVSFTIHFSDYVMSALHKIPFVVAGTLIFLSITTTGALSLTVGVVFYFLRLTQLSQDYIEELVWYLVKKIGARFRRRQQPNTNDQTNTLSIEPSDENRNEQKSDDERCNKNDEKSKNEKGDDKGNEPRVVASKFSAAQNAMFFHATVFMIWALLTLINLPSALTWAHNFKYNTSLKPDPSFFPGFVLSICALPLWQLELPKVEKKDYKEIGFMVTALALVSLVYAPISIYRLNYTLTSAVVLVILHQLLGRDREVNQSEDENDGQSPERLSYSTVKAKLE